MTTSARRFLVVGEPFFRLSGEKVYSSSTVPGDVLVLDAGARPDADGDVHGRIEGAATAILASVSIEALVEVDAEGYPLSTPDFVLEGESDDDELDAEDRELLAALAPLAVVILGRAR